MTKVVKDGAVAVLYSASFGGGWSSWADEQEKTLLLFDPDIVHLVLQRESGLISARECEEQVDIIIQLKGYTCAQPALLHVCWVPVGSRFIVQEYDGQETVVTQDAIQWHVA